jgi:hypothetical protein
MIHTVAFSIYAGKLTIFDRFHKTSHASLSLGADVCEAADKLGLMSRPGTEHVVPDKDL